jgi:hypothetical protein
MNFGYLWSDLKFSAGNATYQLVAGTNWRIKNDKSDLIFKNQRYQSVAVHIAKQLLMSELEGQVHKLFPKFQKHMDQQMRDVVLKQQDTNRAQLIKNQESPMTNWGRINAEGGHTIVAKDKYGNFVPESLMIYYDDEQAHVVDDVQIVAGVQKSVSYSTKTICHIDLSPQISMNSSKNIVMTQVQGRDYTRKELVSGGDLQFTINGNIVSDEQGVYPSDAVKKFVKMMQYNGILNINYMMLEQFNVNRIIVKDYSLGTQVYKNMQPYSITCVAVEPDEDVKIEKDTISVLNTELQLSPMNKWYQLILDNKLAEMTVSAVVNTASSAVVQGTAMGLDKLVPNI